MDLFYRANVTDGLFNEEWNFEDGTPWPGGGKFITRIESIPFWTFSVDHFTIGPPSDSAYEYRLKQWIQSGDPKTCQQCKHPVLSFLFLFFILNSTFLDIKSATSIINKLIYQTPTRSLLYVIDTLSGRPIHRLQQLLSPWSTSFRSFHATRFRTLTKAKRSSSMGCSWSCRRLLYFICGSRIRFRSWRDAYVNEWKTLDGSSWGMGIRGRRGVPPGMGEPEPERDEKKRDYGSSNEWLLRPEVVPILFYLCAFFLLIFF